MTEKVTITLKSVKKTGTAKNGKPYTIFSYTLADGRVAEGFADLPTNAEVEVEMTQDSQYGWKLAKPAQNKFAGTRTAPQGNPRKSAVEISAQLICHCEQLAPKDLFPLADKILAYIDNITEPETAK